ncbi:MAG TPA: DUF742 domain-containing protein [Streptosporangiaceae bacterium]|nr:DUF742 domain-containing protein [Streptosporangiaceae bacterium]
MSVPRHDEWMADGGLSELGADGPRPLSEDGFEKGLFSNGDFGIPEISQPFGVPEQSSSLVRPYAVTGGRTKPSYQLQIEAMVSASHFGARDLSSLSPECQSILGYCRDWRSVAEISAVLRMPLGVARVLIGDMAMEGLVRVHQADHGHGRPDLNLLERVLSGLRKL